MSQPAQKFIEAQKSCSFPLISTKLRSFSLTVFQYYVLHKTDEIYENMINRVRRELFVRDKKHN